MSNNAGNWGNCLRYAAVSDVGLRRANNQDSFNIMLAANQEQFHEQGHIFVVADGMGAHAAGELASKMAADSIPLIYYKQREASRDEALHSAVVGAHQRIYEKGQSDEAFRGMGTTVDSLVILPQGALIGHVGDSRVYRLRGEKYEQLTFDHSLVWELRAAGEFPNGKVPSYIPRNVITRSLGPNSKVDVDLEGPLPLEKGDIFLLCSDGLSGQISDEEMAQILSVREPEKAVQTLVNLANLRGGPDNITIVVVEILAPFDSTAPVPCRRGKSSTSRGVLALAALAMACLLIAVLTALMQQQGIALIAGAAAILMAGIAVVLKFGNGENSPSLDVAPLGKAPYTSVPSKPDEKFVATLAQVMSELRDAAEADQWAINWARFDEHSDRAVRHLGSRRYDAAIQSYCDAIDQVMQELKHQNR